MGDPLPPILPLPLPKTPTKLASGGVPLCRLRCCCCCCIPLSGLPPGVLPTLNRPGDPAAAAAAADAMDCAEKGGDQTPVPLLLAALIALQLESGLLAAIAWE